MMFKTCIAVAAVALATPAFAQQKTGPSNPPGRDAGQSTSDRTPQQDTATPIDQTTSVGGKTSDRTPNNHGENAQNAENSGQSSQHSAQSGGPGTGRPSVMSTAKLKQTLEQAGFKNIRIVDAAYLVHATNSDGDEMVMMFNAPSAMSGGSSNATGASSGTSGSASDNPQYNSETAPRH